jgi:hypothetical protein
VLSGDGEGVMLQMSKMFKMLATNKPHQEGLLGQGSYGKFCFNIIWSLVTVESKQLV